MLTLAKNLNFAPKQLKHIHLMGICGTGMAALAGMLQTSGYTVTGSDNQIYPPMSIFLSDLNISVCSGYGADNLSPSPDLVIVGNVITRQNPEAIALAKRDIPYLSFSPGPFSFLYTISDLTRCCRHPRQNHHMLSVSNRPLSCRS